MRQRNTLVVCAGALLASGASNAQITLPCQSDFNADTVGTMPVLGTPDNPTHILKRLDTEQDPLVQSSALGLADQPVTFNISSDALSGVLLVYDFEPNITTTILRAEASISVNAFANLIVLRTWENSFGQVLGDVLLNESGEIRGIGGLIGTYTPGTPFRVRIEVDVTSGHYALGVDNELDGFADDPMVSGLTFMNDPAGVSNVGGFGIGYLASEGLPNVVVAFDDILMMEIPAPGLAWVFVGAAPLALRRHRR